MMRGFLWAPEQQGEGEGMAGPGAIYQWAQADFHLQATSMHIVYQQTIVQIQSIRFLWFRRFKFLKSPLASSSTLL